jgi:tRNA(adenine34) deaminase
MIEPFNDEYFMKKAFGEAIQAFEEGEIPVGAVVVANNKIIARAQSHRNPE